MRAVSNVYVSCGGKSGLLMRARRGEATRKTCVNVFSDEAYGRSSLTLAGELKTVMAAAHEIVALAVENLSLDDHHAKHPRIGVADHVLLSPVHPEDLDSLEDAARDLAQSLTESTPRLKTAAYSRSAPLAALRRATPYFTDAALSGPLDPSLDRTSELTGVSTFGPERFDSSLGMTCVGAAPWITNFNVPLPSGTTLEDAKRIANAIRSRGGGEHALPAVQAVGLAHSDGRVEIGCNLQDLSQTSPPDVEVAIAKLLGIKQQVSKYANLIGLEEKISGYVIGKRWDELLSLAER
ncbi:Formimidoyltransferase-cyclodeaminase [Hondaea fermentalgiana]|uniref:Formimidoyltransferase-cyclodeaminase n=1 Tax=Hondaea fermentalgiana TaxID=2315210 RepID=A0A2R5GCN0_9STRA|nr:Formimidoyltransferase-cyclodeaminase [Hondaea fermentalgiana]|eukprot:GBG25524.1 Formimidoyltransferase-cyclodeaminase [Hondaea fermentalgiana]